MTQPTTTLARIKAEKPCRRFWRRGLRKAGGLHKYGPETPITVRQIVEAVGLNAALWCLQTMPEHDRRWRLLAVRYARRVQHSMPASCAYALDVAERYMRGLATAGELADARKDAEAAAWAALRALRAEAEWAASWIAAETTAGSAVLAPWRVVEWIYCTTYWGASYCPATQTVEREWQAAELIRICEEDFK